MREILFRGKLTYIGEWVEGYYEFGYDADTETPTHYMWVLNHTEKYGEMFIVIPETVGQYTGLTDKNGKRIFEGDIGKYKQTDGAKRNGKPIICTGKVIYNKKTASYAVESKDEMGCKYFDYFPIKDFEIIGNIHDNPDLLN